jgi:hypothetical protein
MELSHIQETMGTDPAHIFETLVYYCKGIHYSSLYEPTSLMCIKFATYQIDNKI